MHLDTFVKNDVNGVDVSLLSSAVVSFYKLYLQYFRILVADTSIRLSFELCLS